MMFLYLLFKLGICQCIARSLCKICCAGCEAYWFALEDMSCFLWHKLKNTKRVNRRRYRPRFQDIEAGCSSSSGSDYSDNYHYRRLSDSRKRNREKKRHKSQRYCPHQHHVKLKTSRSCTRLSNSRRLQIIIKGKKAQKDVKVFKRRRMR